MKDRKFRNLKIYQTDLSLVTFCPFSS